MILIRPSNWATGTPPTALVTSGMAVWLRDPITIQGFQRIGVPLVLMPAEEISSFATNLSPNVEHTHAAYTADPTEPNFLPLVHTVVDGGAANTVYFEDGFDGGDESTTEFLNLPVDGGTGYVSDGDQRVQLRRGLAADWLSTNPTLGAGEPGMELDTGRLKVGDGVRDWTHLPYTALDSSIFVTALRVSPLPPIVTFPGMIWLQCAAGGTFTQTPPVVPPFTGSTAFSASGTLTAGPG